MAPLEVGAHDHVHDHVVGFYEQDEQLISAIASFFAPALDTDGAAIVIATPARRAPLEAALAAGGFDVADLVRTGRLQLLDAAETLAAFMRGDKPDPVAFASVIGTALDGLTGTGPVHAFGEMVALLWDDGHVNAAIELESLWNDLAEHRTFSLYCAYSMSSLDSAGDLAAAKHVCDRHSNVIRLSSSENSRTEPLTLETGDEFVRTFVPAPVGSGEARRFVREVLQLWGEDRLLEKAELIVAELASNAVLHARSPFRVSVSRQGSEIKISVQDASKRPPENLAHLAAGPGHQGGRGIWIVAELSRNWDTQPERDGKTIWATMTRTA
jgi:anti-sigma regulatory factor (Ser/Thr protein kinase)